MGTATSINFTTGMAASVTGSVATVSSSGGGIGLSSRTTAQAITVSLANNATDLTQSITGFKGYALYSIQVTAAAWVRIYTSQAARSADSSRLQTTDPTPGSGVVAEVITSGAATHLITPSAIGFSSESTPTTAIPITVTNLSGSQATITVTLTLLQLET